MGPSVQAGFAGRDLSCTTGRFGPGGNGVTPPHSGGATAKPRSGCKRTLNPLLARRRPRLEAAGALRKAGQLRNWGSPPRSSDPPKPHVHVPPPGPCNWRSAPQIGRGSPPCVQPHSQLYLVPRRRGRAHLAEVRDRGDQAHLAEETGRGDRASPGRALPELCPDPSRPGRGARGRGWGCSGRRAGQVKFQGPRRLLGLGKGVPPKLVAVGVNPPMLQQGGQVWFKH